MMRPRRDQYVFHHTTKSDANDIDVSPRLRKVLLSKHRRCHDESSKQRKDGSAYYAIRHPEGHDRDARGLTRKATNIRT